MSFLYCCAHRVRPPEPVTRECATPQCSVTFTCNPGSVRRYCTHDHAKLHRDGAWCGGTCGRWLWRGQGSWDVPVCNPCREVAARARQVAAAAAREAARDAAQPRCDVCGVPYRRTYTEQRTCGRACGVALRRREYGHAGAAGAPRSPVHYGQCRFGCLWVSRRPPGDVCPVHAAAMRVARRAVRRTAVIAGAGQRAAVRGWRRCEWCGNVTGRPRHCSDRCGKRANRAARDRAKGRFKPSPVQRRRVYERDELVCHLCLTPVRLDVPDTDTWAGTLDHVVPHAHGGSHGDGNLRTAHRWCNTVRGDGPPIGRWVHRGPPLTWAEGAEWWALVRDVAGRSPGDVWWGVACEPEPRTGPAA